MSEAENVSKRVYIKNDADDTQVCFFLSVQILDQVTCTGQDQVQNLVRVVLLLQMLNFKIRNLSLTHLFWENRVFINTCRGYFSTRP